MNLSSRVVYVSAHDEECWCCLFMYRAFFAFCRKKNLWLFKKMLKKCSEKKMFFYWCSYTLCIQTIMNTNKVHVSARLLFIKRHQDAVRYSHLHKYTFTQELNKQYRDICTLLEYFHNMFLYTSISYI